MEDIGGEWESDHQRKVNVIGAQSGHVKTAGANRIRLLMYVNGWGTQATKDEMEMRQMITVTLQLSRETKNTYKYDAISDDAAVRTVYVQKESIPDYVPDKIILRVDRAAENDKESEGP